MAIENSVIPTALSNDITTRLLAQENLLIQRAPVSTASFDIKTRILTLPQWKNMTPLLEEMLKAHEVGHALYSDYEQIEASKVSNAAENVPHGFLNIIEDARIEKLMRRKYPGLRSVFAKGYAALSEMDFFDLSQRNISDLCLMDRINIFFKLGMNSGVKFTAEEKEFVDRISRVESIDEMIVLTKDIYEYAKEQQEQEIRLLKDMDTIMVDSSDEDDYESSDYDYDDMDEENRHEYEVEMDEDHETDDDIKVGSSGAGHASEPDEEAEDKEERLAEKFNPVTYRAMEKKLQDLADTSTEYQYIDMIDFSSVADQMIVPYKKVLVDNANAVEERMKSVSYMSDYYKAHWQKRKNDLENGFDKFIGETNRVVSYLVKEFEMKKAATNYRRINIAKTGVLDVSKLAQHKVREDLFRTIAMTKDGQKHGFLFIIDWSGSMGDYLNDTVRQLISLVAFCHRVKIPFQVFAFSDHSHPRAKEHEGEYDAYNRLQRESKKLHQSQKAERFVSLYSGISMIELFSHKMTLGEMRKMQKTVYAMSLGFTGTGYSLNGTPLNESLAFVYAYAEKFITANQVEKFTFIKLTDGDGGPVNAYSGPNDNGVRTELPVASGHTYRTVNGVTKRIRVVNFLRDQHTKKVYEITRDTIWGNLLTQLIKERYGCATIGFHVTGKRAREVNYAMATYGNETTDLIVHEKRRDMIKDNFVGLTVFGHDELFLLRGDTEIAEGDMEENIGTMTAAAIAKRFGKYMTTKKTSRILLNRFVKVVA